MRSASLRATSVGVNQVAGCIDWGPEGLIAYGAHSQVILYDVQDAAVVATMRSHTDRVNCITWLPRQGAAGDVLLATGSADHAVIVWRVQLFEMDAPWLLEARLLEHTGPVASISAQQLQDGTTLLVSSASDGQLCVWGSSSDSGGGWKVLQKITFGIQLQLCADVTHMPGLPGWLLLACGGVDGAVRLLVRPPGAPEFVQACKLLGHQDWVRSVAFRHTDPSGGVPGRLLLASGSQDRNVRIWAVLPEERAAELAACTPSHDPEQPQLPSFISRFAPKPRVPAGGTAFVATLESVLVGHEDWVHAVAWKPLPPPASAAEQSCAASRGGGSSRSAAGRPCLLSASMDRTMMLWRPDEATGLWLSEESVGDAGASHLGYFSGRFSPDGASIVANGYTGALHIWQRDRPGAALEQGASPASWQPRCSSLAEGRWVPHHAAGGHHGAVADMTWAFEDSTLLTVAHDHTARAFGSLPTGGWCEVARPQMHGHDFSAVAFLPERDAYAAAAEEKVVRVLEAPQVFFDTLAALCGVRLQPRQLSARDISGAQADKALGGAVTALGLSQKAVHAGDDRNLQPAGAPGSHYSQGPDLAPTAAPSVCTEPPLEEQLAQATLWPEARKLFGHGNNVQAVACHATLLASAAESKTADLADIWLWDTQTWACLGRLAAHGLSVTQLAFSVDGHHLLSASRDRSFAVFSRSASSPADGVAPLTLAGKVARAHARMLLAVSWAPDASLFATGGRDNSVKLWAMTAAGPSSTALVVLKLESAATAVAFAPATSTAQQSRTCFHLAIGLENGSIQLYEVKGPANHVSPSTEPVSKDAAAAVTASYLWRATTFDEHSAAVRRLCWRFTPGTQKLQLASCSEDHAVKLFDCW